MKTLPDSVIKLYRKFDKICSENDLSSISNDIEYKKVDKKISNAYNRFAEECNKFGLDHFRVSEELLGNDI